MCFTRQVLQQQVVSLLHRRRHDGISNETVLFCFSWKTELTKLTVPIHSRFHPVRNKQAPKAHTVGGLRCYLTHRSPQNKLFIKARLKTFTSSTYFTKMPNLVLDIGKFPHTNA